MSIHFRRLDAFQLKDYQYHLADSFHTVSQITKGSFYNKTDYLELPSQIVITRRYTQKMLLEAGQISPGDIVFALIPRGNIFFERSKFPDKNNVSVRQGPYDFKAFRSGTSRHITLRLKKSCLKDICDKQQMDLFSRLSSNECLYNTSDADAFKSLHIYLNTILDLVAVNRSALNVEIATRQITKNVLNKLSELASSLKPSDTRMNAREKWFGKALNAIDSFDQPITIDTLCQQINVSRRNLEVAFNECIGIAPAEYLSTLRLNQVYKALVAHSSDEVTVAQVAQAQGFSHMGNFSRKYHLHFDELPSETLRCRDDNTAADEKNNSEDSPY